MSDTYYCEDHKKKDDRRLNSYQRGYDNKWSKSSRAFLSRHPFCVHCLREKTYTLATEVDHVIPHRGDKELFWDVENWQPLCHEHHSKKTQQEDGFNKGWARR